MENKQILLQNIETIHTTEMGIDRIRKNLKLGAVDVVEFCKKKYRIRNAVSISRGKTCIVRLTELKSR
ncbi:DUF3781 domain-containing protein [Treponema sp. HNW]